MVFDPLALPLERRRVLLAVPLLLIVSLAPVHAQAPPSLTGTVLDARDDLPLFGAKVILRNPETRDVVRRTTTDRDGDFEMDRLRPGRYVVQFRLLGYKEEHRSLIAEMGMSRHLNVRLERQTASLETVVVSASRTEERLLEAPASMSVLEPERLRRAGTPSSVEALRQVPGVDMAQTGVDRREVALRGFNGVFSSTPHVLTDHRRAAAPLLGLNVYSTMPNVSLDLDRVEVVRGPASALYGPGADGGVLHFFSSDPFQNPGTEVSVAGGTRQYTEAQVRQAGTEGSLGYKITGQFGRADEWDLDPTHPQDADELSRYYEYGPNEEIPSTRRTIDRRLRREDQYRKYQANGLLTYRLADETRLSLRGGHAVLTSPLQTSIGTIQASGLTCSYSQLHLETPSLSGQLTFNHNEAEEDLYLYRTGTSPIDAGQQWDGQLQYRLDEAPRNTELLFGTEATFTRRTGTGLPELAAGVNAVDEIGGYVQSSTPLSSALSLTLAARTDYTSITDDVHVSPRAALVFAPSNGHSVRASVNRSVSTPAANLLFGTRLTEGLAPSLQAIRRTGEIGYKGTLTDRMWVEVDAYVEEQQNVVAPVNTDPLTYGTMDRIQYWGLDASVEASPTESVQTGGTVSYVSEDWFAPDDPEDTPPVALNAPSFKVQGRVDYELPAGISLGGSGQYVDDFPVRAGPYVGTVDGYFRLDLRASYRVPSVPGLRVALTGTNVLDTEHREFVGAPAIGRMVMGQITYDLP